MPLRSDVSGGVTVGVVGEFSITDAKLVVDVGSSAIENDSEDPQDAMRPASITVASATLDTRATVTPSLSQTRWPITRRYQQSLWDRSVYPNWRAHLHQLSSQIQAIARHRKVAIHINSTEHLTSRRPIIINTHCKVEGRKMNRSSRKRIK